MSYLIHFIAVAGSTNINGNVIADDRPKACDLEDIRILIADKLRVEGFSVRAQGITIANIMEFPK